MVVTYVITCLVLGTPACGGQSESLKRFASLPAVGEGGTRLSRPGSN